MSNATSAFEQLRESEIPFSLDTFVEPCFTVRLGDPMNGFLAETHTDTLMEAANWLAREALRFFPESKFARSRSRAPWPIAADVD